MRALCLAGLAALLPPLAAAAATMDGPTVAGQARNVAAACGGGAAAVRGSGNQVTFIGPCASLRISGSRNNVIVALDHIGTSTGTIDISGDDNHVVYTPGAPPPVTVLYGYYNTVVPGPAGATPTTVVLDGALGMRDVHCDGLDVIIRESSSRYVLRGGCRSVTVQARSTTVAAELLPASLLSIGGVGVVINYVLVAQGPPPSVVVTASHASATHLVRSGESAILLPTTTALR